MPQIVVYANTCAEWMTSAIAAFKHSLAVVTIYTNLGEAGVEHGLQQTRAAVIVTSHDLLPRLTKVPTLRTLQLTVSNRAVVKEPSRSYAAPGEVEITC